MPSIPTETRSRRSNRSAVLIERIELRLLLSTYTVTNLNDSGPGSLRDAVQQANTNPEPDLITFASGLTGIIPASASPPIINDVSGITSWRVLKLP